MWAVVHATEEDDDLARKLNTNETSITRGDLYLLDCPETLRSLGFENKLLAGIANAIQQTGLGSFQEAYMCIIPPLSFSCKLPMEAIFKYILQRTREREMLGRWEKIVPVYFHSFRKLKKLRTPRRIFLKIIAMLIHSFLAVSNTLRLREGQERTDGVRGLRQVKEAIFEELKNRGNTHPLSDLIQCRYFMLKRQSHQDSSFLEELRRDPGTSIGSKIHRPGIFSKISSDQLTSDEEVRSRDIFDWTPLHYAAVLEDGKAITKLLELKADPNALDLADWTPMHYAIENTNEEKLDSIVSALLARGADTEIRGRDGMGPLHCAAKQGYARVIESLTRAGASVDIEDNSRMTPLHWAAYAGSVDGINILLRNGAYAKARDDYERTPLHLAALAGRAGAVEELLGVKKIKRGLTDRDGRIPLHLAAIKGSEEVVRLLLDKNQTAMINTVDNDERTPLDLAIRFGREDAAVLLSNMYDMSNNSEEGITFGTAILFRRVEAVREWVVRLDKKDLESAIKFTQVL